MSLEISKATIEQRLDLWAPLASGIHANDPATD